MLDTLVAAARAGSATGHGLVCLLTVGVTAFLWLVYDWDRAARLKVAAFGLLALVLFVAAGYAALPPPLPTTDARIILIDESSDWAHGLPAGIFDQGSTRHMMRHRMGGPMWAPAGGRPYGVGWKVYVVKPARYQLEVQYSAETSHPAEVRLDEETRFVGLARTTGDRWQPRWFREGTIELHAGVNRLAFFAEEGLPWIMAVRLIRLDGDASRAAAGPATAPRSDGAGR